MAVQTELADNIAYGIDLKNRRIYFGVNIDNAESEEATDFTLASVEIAVRAMHRMVSDATGKPIEIHMSSYGGDIYAMLRLHDEILACPCQVKFFGGGAIMSSATFIMACCDERYLYPNASIMVHELSTGSDGRHTDIQVNAGEDRRVMSKLYDIYAVNSKMPREFWEDVCQRDLYLTAEEAITLGLADKIVEPKKRGNLRKSRQAVLKKQVDHKQMKKLLNDIYNRINKVKIPKIELNEFKKEEADPGIAINDSLEDISTAISDSGQDQFN